MIRFGFEQEFFVVDPANPKAPVQLVPKKIPNDAGLLAEARGKPSSDPVEAAFSLHAAAYRIERDLPSHLALSTNPVKVVPPELRIKARRTHTKDLIHYQNLYGHDRHPVEAEEMTAGIHVSVTREQTIRCDDKTRHYNTMFDFAQFIIAMDERYKGEIEAAQRHPGFYEIKHDGRVEYRSLPTTTDVLDVAEYLRSITSKIHGSWSKET